MKFPHSLQQHSDTIRGCIFNDSSLRGEQYQDTDTSRLNSLLNDAHYLGMRMKVAYMRYSLALESIVMVTGPSLINATAISAPNSPV